MSYRYLGYGITDSNGEAKLEYDENGNHLDHSITGTGAGELDIVASLDKPIDSGSLVSETYSIIDATWIDDGTMNIWYNQQNTQVDTSSGEYKRLYTTGSSFIYRFNANATLEQGNCIEFDFYQEDGANSDGLLRFFNTSIANKGTFRLNSAELPIGEWVHIKFTFKDNTVIMNDIVATAQTISETALKFGFISNGTTSAMRFKNFMMYPI